MTVATSLKEEKVSRFPLSAVVLIDSGSSLRDALKKMAGHKGDCALVCDADGFVAGIFTERDVLTKVAGKGVNLSRPVDAYMTTRPQTVNQRASIKHALVMMIIGHFRNIPVLDERRKPVGVLSMSDILHYLAESFPEGLLNLAPMPDQKMETEEGG
jgi:CBS domain-containing protein